MDDRNKDQFSIEVGLFFENGRTLDIFLGCESCSPGARQTCRVITHESSRVPRLFSDVSCVAKDPQWHQ
jgi:hypothetical protein